MDKKKRELKGSPARDAFKQFHKTILRPFYAVDLDLVFVEKTPIPGVVAVLDYKQPNDRVSFSEVLLYNKLLEVGIPVFVVISAWCKNQDPPFNNFAIFRYCSGDHRPEPPLVDLETIHHSLTFEEFVEWEGSLRTAYKRSYSPVVIADSYRNNPVWRCACGRIVPIETMLYGKCPECSI